MTVTAIPGVEVVVVGIVRPAVRQRLPTVRKLKESGCMIVLMIELNTIGCLGFWVTTKHVVSENMPADDYNADVVWSAV